MRIKHSQVPLVRQRIAKLQNNVCPLCQGEFKGSKQPVLDHDHKTGYVRDVLCNNCNGMEGKIYSRAVRGAGAGNDPIAYLQRVVDYWKKHATPQWATEERRGIIHPTHKTEAQKKERRLKLARQRYHANKAKKAKK